MYLKYLKYVLRHKWYVFVECYKMGLLWQGLWHDMSKFRLSEFIPYARFFYGDWFDWEEIKYKCPAYSWTNTKQGVKEAFDLAWLHHQHRNQHHWQYWLLQNDEDGAEKIPMPWNIVREMVCDWKGAGAAQGKKGDTKNWYEKNKDKMVLHEHTREIVERLLGW